MGTEFMETPLLLRETREGLPVAIRRAAVGDIREIADIYIRGYQEHHWGQDFPQEEAIAIVEEYLNNPYDTSLVITSDNMIKGFVLSSVAPRDTAIKDLINSSSTVTETPLKSSIGKELRTSPEEVNRALWHEEGVSQEYRDLIDTNVPVLTIGEIVIDPVFRRVSYPDAFINLFLKNAHLARSQGATKIIAMTVDKGPLYRNFVRAGRFGIAQKLYTSLGLYDEEGQPDDNKLIFLLVHLDNPIAEIIQKVDVFYFLLKLPELLPSFLTRRRYKR